MSLLLLCLLVSCTHTVTTVRPVPVTKVNTIHVKCNLPRQPSPLARPLPLENPQKLIDRLTVKLDEWAGPNGYGDKVEKACK